MTRYDLLVFLHVCGAIVWIGLGLAGHAIAMWAERRQEWDFAHTFSRAIAWVEPAAIVAGPLLLIVTGVALVLDGPWSFGDTWVAVGLAGYVGALALGGAVQAPGTRRLNAILAERGPRDPEAITLFRRLNGFMWPELAILLVVLLAMTTKPLDGGSAGFWIAVAAILVAGLALLAHGRRSPASPASTSS